MAEASAGEIMHRSVLGGPLGRVLSERRAEVLAIAERHGLTDVRVFGSVARGDDGPDSDVDLLVDLPAGMGLFGLGRAAEELEDLLQVAVDLVPARSLKPRVRPEVEAETVAL